MNESEKLTPEQILHWRKIWPLLFGVTATCFSDEDIQKMRDNLKKRYAAPAISSDAAGEGDK